MRPPSTPVIVTAGAPSVPSALKNQLSDEGGRLVIPVGPRHQQALMRYTRTGNEYVTEQLLNCAFVPLVGSEGWPSASDDDW
jgi:protein-L-isoaspartate(D-aspartate) O-methyltransferase